MRITYRAIRGRKRFLDTARVMAELARTLKQVVEPELTKRFEHVVANWKTAVAFKAKSKVSADGISVEVVPTGPGAKIWGYVSRGTPRHDIPAKPGKRLFFIWGGPGSYKPKTKPGGKFGGPGTVTGGKVTRPLVVDHPGTEAREFEETISDDMTPWFRRIMENAWRRGIRAAAR